MSKSMRNQVRDQVGEQLRNLFPKVIKFRHQVGEKVFRQVRDHVRDQVYDVRDQAYNQLEREINNENKR